MSRNHSELPVVSSFLWWGFTRYVHRYVRRHFNAMRVAKETAPRLLPDEPVICFTNHPSWWDPLIGIVLNERYLRERVAYAPIDQTALRQYPIFRKLGFYGIDLASLDGAKRYLSVTRQLLQKPHTVIWMTPGGTFADVRSRTTFQPGIGHVAASVSGVALVPVAVEYPFWEERTPEALIEFGSIIRTPMSAHTKADWQHELEDRLAAAQASLAAKAISRDAAAFDVVLSGSAGVGGWYDVGRRLRSLLGGSGFDPRHGGDRTRSGFNG